MLLPTATVVIRNGAPFSSAFNDIYHSPDGIAESRRVFIALNNLPARFAALQPRQQFFIGELGFGTGLNCLLATQEFLKCAPTTASLHVVSFEAQPLGAQQLQQLTPFRQPLADLHAQLVEQCPPPLRGWHRRWLASRVRLSLFHGDAHAGLQSLIAVGASAMDAWFLDGFAPVRNPTMWSDELLAGVAALSKGGTTAATFTSAGRIRRSLQAAGFNAERVDGMPHKRHYLRAIFAADNSNATRTCAIPQRVRIIGGGIAGAFLADALGSRGVACRVVDPAQCVPGGASANPSAALQIRLPQRMDSRAVLRLRALTMAAARLAMPSGDANGNTESPWRVRGLLHLALGHDATGLAPLAAALPDQFCAVDTSQASDIAGLHVTAGGLYLPASGSVNLSALCRALLAETPMIQQLESAAADDDELIIYASPQAALGVCRDIPLFALPGTVSFFSCATLPRVVLSGDGYLAAMNVSPSNALSRLAAGGTYERANETSGQADAANLARCQRFGVAVAPIAQGRFRAQRWNTRDRLPLIGRVPWLSARGAPASWLCTGLGSAGLTFAPLAAELIASQLCGEPPPVDGNEVAMLAPTRWDEPVG